MFELIERLLPIHLCDRKIHKWHYRQYGGPDLFPISIPLMETPRLDRVR